MENFNKGINVLSLFDGISCGQIALGRADVSINNYFASEIDKNAIKITQNNYPGTIQLGSVLDIKVEDLPKINLVCAGFPCQSHSFAGKQRGFNDPRGQLFFNAVGVLAEIKKINPDVKFLFENVKMKKESAALISQHLGVDPITINSAVVSGQNRQRMYWTNIQTSQPEDKKNFLCDVIENGYVDRDKSYCIDANYYKGGNPKQYFQKSRRQLVFLQPEFSLSSPGLFRKLSVLECERLQNLPPGYTAGTSDSQRYKVIGNGWTVDVIAHIFKGLKYK